MLLLKTSTLHVKLLQVNVIGRHVSVLRLNCSVFN